MTDSRRDIGLAVGGLLALAAAMGIGRFVYTPILPFMVEGFGLSKAEGGLIASANYLGYLVGALAAASGHLPGGRRRWFLSMLALSASTTAFMGLAGSVWIFAFLRFLGGIASAFVLVLSSSLVLDRLSRSGRSELSSLHFSGVGTGIAASAVLVSVFSSLGAGWAGLWLWSGAFSFAGLLAAVFLVPGDADEAETRSRATPGKTPASILALIVSYGLFGFGYVITATFISTMVRLTPNLQSLESVVWLAVGLAAAPSVFVWSKIANRIGIVSAYSLACLTQAVGVAISVLIITGPSIILAAILLGGTIIGLTALGFMEVRRVTKGDPRRLMALMTASFGLGQMIGPTFAGYLYDLTGNLTIPSLIAAGALVVAAILGIASRRMAD